MLGFGPHVCFLSHMWVMVTMRVISWVEALGLGFDIWFSVG